MSLSASSSGYSVIRPSITKKLPTKSVGNTVSFCRDTKQGAGTKMNKKTLFGFRRMSVGLPFLFHSQFSQPSSQCWEIGVFLLDLSKQGEWEGLGSLLSPTLDTTTTPDPGAVSSGKFSLAVPTVQTKGEGGQCR